MSADGFYFCFDEPTREVASHTNNNNNSNDGGGVGHAWPAPSTSLAAFPWLALDEARVCDWLASYPDTTNIVRTTSKDGGHGRKGRGAGGQTRPLQLQMACDATSAGPAGSHTITLCYQTAPEVSVLNDAAGTAGARRDIVPGRYYGGLKVWSCAASLVGYLCAHAARWQPRWQAEGAVVAEVGCGQGLGGLAALCLGARRVIFQDYNEEVLECCVKGNVAATCRAAPPIMHAAEVKLVHGDWTELGCATDADLAQDRSHNTNNNNNSSVSCDGGCDVVLGSDVTFDAEACDKLACLLRRWLRAPDGVALIASKVYYFGTNGGVVEFAQCAERVGLVVRELHKIAEDGAETTGMQQVILQVTHQ